jgi:hypothetical protein
VQARCGAREAALMRDDREVAQVVLVEIAHLLPFASLKPRYPLLPTPRDGVVGRLIFFIKSNK